MHFLHIATCKESLQVKTRTTVVKKQQLKLVVICDHFGKLS